MGRNRWLSTLFTFAILAGGLSLVSGNISTDGLIEAVRLVVNNPNTSQSAAEISGSTTNSAFPALKVNNNGAGGYGLYVDKTNGAGVASFGANNGSTGSGVAGYSENWYGVYGYTGASSNNYGIYSPDNLYSRNFTMSGAMMMVVENAASTPLRAGDVVEFVGFDKKQRGGEGMVQVGASSGEQTTAVAGVVHSRFHRAMLDAPIEGPSSEEMAAMADASSTIESGDLLLMVVYGPAMVNTSALVHELKPGDLVSASAINGRAGSKIGEGEAVGSILGKALGPVRPGTEQIPVFVTLH